MVGVLVSKATFSADACHPFLEVLVRQEFA